MINPAHHIVGGNGDGPGRQGRRIKVYIPHRTRRAKAVLYKPREKMTVQAKAHNKNGPA
jgi:hypothetical protein